MKRLRVGIDLGTSYSSLSCLDDHDKPVSISCEGNLATPSAVFFPPGGKPPVVGDEALAQTVKLPDRVIANSKRLFGVQDAGWVIDGVMYTPVNIAAIILRKLIVEAQKEGLGAITDAVITVPAHFSGYQRQLVIEAGKLAGLTKVNVVNEPVAAALTFVLQGSQGALSEDERVNREMLEDAWTILVYDLGGGTFDLSLVQYDDTQLRVLAACGDQQLGGIDWNVELFKMILEPLRRLHPRSADDPNLLRSLCFSAEHSKRALSNLDSTTLEISHQDWNEDFRVERKEFEERTAFLAERTRQLTEQLLKTTGRSWNDIDALVPVGGSIRIPRIKRVLESFAEQRKDNPNFVRKVSPDLSVATGAALFAGMLAQEGRSRPAGRFAQRLANYRTVSVTSQSLGILLRDPGGKYTNHLLIPKNSPLPATTTVRVSTVHDNQPHVSIRIMEGDDSNTARQVCKCRLDGLPPNLPANSLFDVDLSYDVDGLLHVVATHCETGRLATVSRQHSVEVA